HLRRSRRGSERGERHQRDAARRAGQAQHARGDQQGHDRHGESGPKTRRARSQARHARAQHSLRRKTVNDLKPGLYAILETTLGEITCRLFPDKAPKAVENFRGLAEAAKEFSDAKTGARTKRRYYDGLV